MEASQTPAPKTNERPELLVGAALLGGILLAQVLKRLAHD
jgi:hypothetical protein